MENCRFVNGNCTSQKQNKDWCLFGVVGCTIIIGDWRAGGGMLKFVLVVGFLVTNVPSVRLPQAIIRCQVSSDYALASINTAHLMYSFVCSIAAGVSLQCTNHVLFV